MASNRLANETSPYLLQHADNPVFWFPWGEEPFENARQQNKPVFLSIGYSTCHWCHVMAHESFEDQETADILNNYFISIKVDREERPDVDHIYMNAVLRMHGQGGWPLSVFLMPDGKPFFGGTYFPAAAKWGTPGFKDVLLSICQAWQSNQEGIKSSAEQLNAILEKVSEPEQMVENDERQLQKIAVDFLQGLFDHVHGGFSSAPKFPMGHTLSFLLSQYRNQPNASRMAEHTLTVMRQRGIHDHLASGFHRYATDGQWQVPHFEKMLYDQALLSLAYTQAWQVTQKKEYADTARSILDFVIAELRDQCGGFYCAFDADSGGQEGAYYVFSEKEIDENLKDEQAVLFKKYFGTLPQGNVSHDPHGEFTGKNILYTATDVDVLDAVTLNEARRKMLDYRQRRAKLHCDHKILSDWNGLMVSALSYAGAVLEEEMYIDAAKQAVRFLKDNCWSGKRLMHSLKANCPPIKGMLDDYAYYGLGLLSLYETTLDAEYLEDSLEIARTMIDLFEDHDAGGFFLCEKIHDLIVRPMELYDGAMPSGNSVAAYVLIKLYYITGLEDLGRAAGKAIGRALPKAFQAPQGYTFLLQALSLQLSGPLQVTIQGGLTGEQLVDLRKIVYKYFIPNLALKRVHSDEVLTVQVCRQGVCGLASSDFNSLQGQLL